MVVPRNEQSNAREIILAKVREIVMNQLRGIKVKVWLYGSWARQEERRTSDIDVAIWSEDPLPMGVLSKLRSALDEAPILYPVEVTDLRESDETFIQQVLKEGIEWND